jgi:hypothetical protein
MSAHPRPVPTTCHAAQSDHAGALLDLLARGALDPAALRELLEVRRRALQAEVVAIERCLGLRPARSERRRPGHS